ncbi:MAG: hypothetical protein ACQEVA_17745 [Myxococcota bacterium]
MSDDDNKEKGGEEKSDESLLNDVAITAEFEYQEDWESLRELSSSVSDDAENEPEKTSSTRSKKKKKKNKANSSAKQSKKPERARQDSITRALDDFDSYLDDQSSGRGSQADSADFVDEADSKDMPAPDLTNGNRSTPGAWGYDQPQVSGVFSRYEEETSAEDENFDLFAEDDKGEEPAGKTLRELTADHEKKIRRLHRQLDYQKQVLQVMAELLVEARVISRPELKRRLKALRRKNS